MHRIDGPGATVDNKFTEGDPVGGIQATVVTDDWLTAIQEEIVAVISDASVVPAIPLNKAVNNQLITAIKRLIPPTAPDASTTTKGIARFATTQEQLGGVLATVMSNPIGVLSLITTWFPKRSFSASDYIRIPDVSGGLIIQWSSVSGAAGSIVTATFPTAVNTILHVIPFYQFGGDPGTLTNAGGGGVIGLSNTGATFRLLTGFTGTRYLAIGF